MSISYRTRKRERRLMNEAIVAQMVAERRAMMAYMLARENARRAVPPISMTDAAGAVPAAMPSVCASA